MPHYQSVTYQAIRGYRGLQTICCPGTQAVPFVSLCLDPLVPVYCVMDVQIVD